MARRTVLVVEDERALAQVIQYNLETEGHEVHLAHDGRDGLNKARSLLPDLVVLDIMLPALDGLTVCRELRADPRTRGVRVLMLTAKGEEVDELVGFHMGADDYVTKPFKMKPLVARVRNLLKRDEAPAGGAEVVSGAGITVDRERHTATLSRSGGAGGAGEGEEEELVLTPTEFKLLFTLMRQPNRPFSRHELMDASRGGDANALERTIDVHVRSLRQKLGDRGEAVETVRGVGYRFRETDPRAAD